MIDALFVVIIGTFVYVSDAALGAAYVFLVLYIMYGNYRTAKLKKQKAEELEKLIKAMESEMTGQADGDEGGYDH